MAHLRFLAVCFVVVFLTACGGFGGGSGPRPDETANPDRHSPLGPSDPKTETPPEQRVTDALQQAKAAYDEHSYKAAFRYAETAEHLVVDKKVKDRGYRLTAYTIQGYCLFQLKLVDDYRPEGMPGYVEGALAKFNRALALDKDAFRALLGKALCLFQRHGYNIGKAEKLGEGVLCLNEIDTTLRRAFAQKDKHKAAAEFKTAVDLFSMLSSGRQKLISMGEIFHDPSKVSFVTEKDGTRTRPEAPRLPTRRLDKRGNPIPFTESEEILAIKDLQGVIEYARDGKELKAEDPQLAYDSIARLRGYWQDVRFYWRKKALVDLQDSRDELLRLRDRDEKEKVGSKKMRYFWIDRDLAFVFASMGAFFLDMAFDDARMLALESGKTLDRVEITARETVLNPKWKNVNKDNAKRNYASCLSYFESFVQEHENFELLMINKTEKADYSDVTENPFLVDLQSRYRAEMMESIREERGLRRAILLEECTLVIDPLFGLNDFDKALGYTNKLKALDPQDPIHFFVRATAHFEKAKRLQEEDNKSEARTHVLDARDEYESFLRQASIAEYSQARKICRERVDDCTRLSKELEVTKSAGGN